MIRFFAVVLCLMTVTPALSQSIERAVGEIAQMVAKYAPSGSTVAIADVTNLSGESTEFGRMLSEELAVAVGNVGGDFQLLERSRIDALISESKLSTSDLFDVETLKRLGKISGADFMLISQASDQPPEVVVYSRLVASETSVTQGSVRVKMMTNKAMERLLELTPRLGISEDSLNSDWPAMEFIAEKQSGPMNLRLKSVERRGTNVVVSFLYKYLDEGRRTFELNPNFLRVITPDGVEIVGERVASGSQTETANIRVLFSQGVPMLVTYIIEGVPSDLEEFVSLELDPYRGADYVQFKNLGIDF